MLLLVLSAVATLSPLEGAVQEYRQCLQAAAGRYARLNEPAETVVTASQAQCVEVRNRMRGEGLRGKPKELTPLVNSMLDDIERDARQQTVKVVLDARLARRGS